MSKQGGKLADTIFPGAGSATEAAGSAAMDYLAPKLPDPAVDTGLAKDPEIQKRATESVPDREAQLRMAAVAAGVTRSGNEADMLGKSGPKRAAGRTLLGSR